MCDYFVLLLLVSLYVFLLAVITFFSFVFVNSLNGKPCSVMFNKKKKRN